MADNLTIAGLETETLEETLQALEDAQRSDVDPLILTGSTAVAGQQNGIVASHLREIREVVQALADAIDPDNAEGDRLDAICEITGTRRLPATKSRFAGTRRVTVNLDSGFTLPSGTRANVLDHPEILFETTEDVMNSGPSAADVLVSMQAVEYGPIHANANTLTVRTTPVAGWNSVNNTTDAIVGRDTEGDQSLRARREGELAQVGSSTVNAIRAGLLDYETEDGERPILDAVVYENQYDFWFQGRPPHSIEAVVWDGPGEDADNEAIGTVLFENKAAGIRSFGTTGVLVEDSYGVSHVMSFSRPTQVSVTLTVTLTYSTGYVGDSAIETIITDAFAQASSGANGTGQRPGKDAYFSAYMSVVQRAGGVVSITGWEWSRGGAPVDFANLEAGAREIFVIDSSDIAIVSTEE